MYCLVRWFVAPRVTREPNVIKVKGVVAFTWDMKASWNTPFMRLHDQNQIQTSTNVNKTIYIYTVYIEREIKKESY